MRHRRWFVRQRKPDGRVLAHLEPGEEVHAIFDGETAFPRCHRFGITYFVALVFGFGAYTIPTALAGAPVALNGSALWPWLALALFASCFVLVAHLGGWSRRTLAATSYGLIVFRLDPLGRPREVLGRQQASPPVLLRRTRAYDYVAFGPNRIWIARDADVVMRYMIAVLP